MLVAVSIPIFTSRLEKARESTDIANMRSAKAAFIAEYLSDTNSNGTVMAYDAKSGTILTGSTATPDPYGKGTSVDGSSDYDGYDNTQDYAGCWYEGAITVTSDGDATLKLYWAKTSGTAISDASTVTIDLASGSGN